MREQAAGHFYLRDGCDWRVWLYHSMIVFRVKNVNCYGAPADEVFGHQSRTVSGESERAGYMAFWSDLLPGQGLSFLLSGFGAMICGDDDDDVKDFKLRPGSSRALSPVAAFFADIALAVGGTALGSNFLRWRRRLLGQLIIGCAHSSSRRTHASCGWHSLAAQGQPRFCIPRICPGNPEWSPKDWALWGRWSSKRRGPAG